MLCFSTNNIAGFLIQNRKMTKTPLDDVLECMICSVEIENAHLCPFCAKPACFECWNSILQSSAKFLCPVCRGPIETRDALIKCGWITDLTKCIKDVSEEAKMKVEETVLTMSQNIEKERKKLNEDKEVLQQEREVYDSELATYKVDCEALQEAKEKHQQALELLSVERDILKDREEKLDREIREFLGLQERAERTHLGSPTDIAADIDFYRSMIVNKTQLIKCTANDKGQPLVESFNNMKDTLNILVEKLLEWRNNLVEPEGLVAA